MPAARNVELLISSLPASSRHAFAVYPGADHGLRVIEPNNTEVPLEDKLAPGFLAMLEAWIVAS